MKQLTIRGFDKELQRQIEDLARTRNLSLNKAALELMRRGAGLQEGPVRPNVVGHMLDQFIGSWSESRERELLEAITPFEEVDEAFWQ
ncbi:MAG TPA: hypothetical protein VFH11_08610 [Gemmatimonadota bacterium]|nr:hypothetical protein [Gemmatimonadota bacterium]